MLLGGDRSSVVSESLKYTDPSKRTKTSKLFSACPRSIFLIEDGRFHRFIAFKFTSVLIPYLLATRSAQFHLF